MARKLLTTYPDRDLAEKAKKAPRKAICHTVIAYLKKYQFLLEKLDEEEYHIDPARFITPMKMVSTAMIITGVMGLYLSQPAQS